MRTLIRPRPAATAGRSAVDHHTRRETSRLEVEAALFADEHTGVDALFGTASLLTGNRSVGEVRSTALAHRDELKQSYNRAFDCQVEVGIGFQVVRIHEVNEGAETFTLDFDMHMTWRDPSLVDVKEPDWDKV
ncbi:hypothetical protein T492DRAFT_890757 [Pavlovales sp. CCMP2436]|nr:hypothetical protein T492DRAFT_890757 [Pavlovales sp. CCMP2436]